MAVSVLLVVPMGFGHRGIEVRLYEIGTKKRIVVNV